MSSPNMTTYVAPKNQPYTLHLHRNGAVEIVYQQSPNSSHASSSRPRHSSTSSPAPSPKSTAATFGSSNTRVAQSVARRESPPSSGSGTRHRDSSTHRDHTHHHHHHSSEHRSTSHTSHHHLPVPSSSDRQRHHSTSSTEKRSLPIPIPQSTSHSHSRSRSHSHTPSPQNSPAKHARFAVLPGSVPPPTITASGHLAAPSHSYNPPALVATSVHPSRSPHHQSSSLAVPVSRHRPSTSADSFFFLQAHRPRGWFNRRGDRFLQKGIIERQPAHMEWHPTFGGYPEPGKGWMDENGHFMPAGGGILKN